MSDKEKELRRVTKKASILEQDVFKLISKIEVKDNEVKSLKEERECNLLIQQAQKIQITQLNKLSQNKEEEVIKIDLGEYFITINHKKNIILEVEIFDKLGEQIEGIYINDVGEEKLTFDEWYCLCEDEVNIELAENGADREMDFDPETEFEIRYQKYLNKNK